MITNVSENAFLASMVFLKNKYPILVPLPVVFMGTECRVHGWQLLMLCRHPQVYFVL
jgi:hypothetical protein